MSVRLTTSEKCHERSSGFRQRADAIGNAPRDAGGGLTDTERELLWAEPRPKDWGQVIEVSCHQLTSGDRFRHPVFVRMHPDKLVAQKRATELSHAKTTSLPN
jgi:ATP-dependent DNA ligase